MTKEKKLTKRGRHWTETDKEYLRKNYHLITIDELSEALGRSDGAIDDRAKSMGLRETRPINRMKHNHPESVSSSISKYTVTRWYHMIVCGANKIVKGNTARKKLIYETELVSSFEYFIKVVGYAPSTSHVLRLRNRAMGYISGNIFWDVRAEEEHNPTLDDLTGRRFGRWTVIGGYHYKNNGNSYWRCQCDCGIVRDVQAYGLKRGKSSACKSCAAKSRARKTKQPDCNIERTAYECYVIIYKRWKEGRITKADPMIMKSFRSFSAEIGPMPSPTSRVALLMPSRGYITGNIVWVEAVAP